MTSPGSKVMPEVMSAMSSRMEKSMYLVLDFCFTSPLTRSDRSRACGSGTASAVRIAGPNGA